MTDRWVNRDAIEWVLYSSEAPAEQRLTLVVIASFTDAEGRGAYPARSLVARMTGRSLRKSERDLAVLVKRGLLLTGDWHIVMHIRADRRPNIYDLPDPYRLWLSRRVRTTPRTGRQGDTPQESTGRQERQNGASGTTERGVSVTPKEVLKTSGKRARDARPPAASLAAKCEACGCRVDSNYHRNICSRQGRCADCGAGYRSGTAWAAVQLCASCFRDKGEP